MEIASKLISLDVFDSAVPGDSKKLGRTEGKPNPPYQVISYK